MGTDRIQASRREGIGLPKMPARNAAHEHPRWFDRDLDEEIEDPDEPEFDPHPTERHLRIPDVGVTPDD